MTTGPEPGFTLLPKDLEFKVKLLLVLTIATAIAFVAYVMYARGVFEPTQRLNLVVDNAEGVSVGMDLIALAHQRGIQVHAKIIVMFMFKAPPEFRYKLLRQDRVMRGPDGTAIIQNGFAWLCPSRPENRAQMVAATRRIVSRYPVDGVQFDYIRFCEEPSCYCKNCRRESAGKDFNAWRQDLITSWAADLSSAARQARPGIKVSAAVFPILERAKEEKAQDWRLWLERGILDYVCTMNYTPDHREFEERCRLAPRTHTVVGIGSWKMQRLDDVTAQIQIARKYGRGFALFSYDDAAARDFLPKVAETEGNR